MANIGYLSASFGGAVPEALRRTIAKPDADANHAVLFLLVYIAVFAVVAAVFVRRRDVT